MTPIEQMTDAEIENEATRQDRNNDHQHASNLRAYLRLRHRFGIDHATWPPDECEAEGLRHRASTHPTQI
jgi:hypothetical protein